MSRKILAVCVCAWLAFAQAGEVFAGPARRMRTSDDRLHRYILAAARYHNLEPSLLQALIWQESRWNHAAVSPKGAIGYTQLMPSTARDIGVNPHDPWHNVFGGAKYLRAMLNRYNNDVALALAAYNAGPAKVVRAIPNIPETRFYVAAVIHYWRWFRDNWKTEDQA